jgi:death on curing protein
VNSQNDIVWLDIAVIHAVHEAQISEHGGGIGVRDANLLESALSRPIEHASYADPTPDVPAVTAIYGIAFVRNHPFIDGNKRTGLIATELFLRRNGFRLIADNAACVVEILALAAGERTDEQFTDWVRRHATR